MSFDLLFCIRSVFYCNYLTEFSSSRHSLCYSVIVFLFTLSESDSVSFDVYHASVSSTKTTMPNYQRIYDHVCCMRVHVYIYMRYTSILQVTSFVLRRVRREKESLLDTCLSLPSILY